MVYRADQDVDGDNELYRVDLATPGVSAKLNGSLPAGGDVSLFRINPDGLQLIYAADQDTEGGLSFTMSTCRHPGVQPS